MNDAERALRGEIIRTCKAMEDKGINQGTSGNVSARWGEGLLITPSGLPYDTMAPEDIIYLSMDGSSEGPHAPSSEWRFHRDIMKEREDVGAIVHAHPAYLTGLSILNKDIPAVHYMIAAVGGPTVRCAPYATYGTDELSRNALDALEGRMGCLLANHGVIACGPGLSKALWLAVEMETLAQQYVIAKMAGKPVVLSDEEIAHVVEKFKGYGPRRKDEGTASAPAPAPAPVPAPEPAPETESASASAPAKAPGRPRGRPRKHAAKAAPAPVVAAPEPPAPAEPEPAPAPAAATPEVAEPAAVGTPAKARRRPATNGTKPSAAKGKAATRRAAKRTSSRGKSARSDA